MGACCCRDDSVESRTNRRRDNRRRAEARTRVPGDATSTTTTAGFGWRHGGTSTTPGSDGMCVCNVCGLRIDPVLLEGHQETCRANYRRATSSAYGSTSSSPDGMSAVAQALNNHKDDSDIEGHDENEVCIVCLERLRCFAFLPCGHIATCGACAKQLDSCPLCRQPRQGLCYVPATALSQYQCKHCTQFIAPTLYDGHREVCALRMRTVAQKAEEERREAATKGDDALLSSPSLVAQPSPTASPQRHASSLTAGAEGTATPGGGSASSPSTSPTTSPGLGPKKGRHLLAMCLECGKEDPHLVICLPCGHRVLCGDCANQRTTCPVCLREIKHNITTYE